MKWLDVIRVVLAALAGAAGALGVQAVPAVAPSEVHAAALAFLPFVS